MPGINPQGTIVSIEVTGISVALLVTMMITRLFLATILNAFLSLPLEI